MPRVEVAQAGEVTVATITGDVELGTVPDLVPALEGLPPSEGAVVVVDLTGVTFLDSSGLSLLVRLNRRVVDGDGQLRLVCAPSTLRLLRLTSMDQVLSLYPTLQDAADGTERVDDAR